MREPTSPQIHAVIVRLRGEGKTYEEIAELTDVGYAVVIDNFNMHKSLATRPLIEADGGTLVCPTYSPELDPIEIL